MENTLKKFCERIFYNFRDMSLLETALTHPSLKKRDDSKSDYERLEFLGDKVLSLVMADFLMKKYPRDNEGSLSKRHALLVAGETLAEIAVDINLSEVLHLSFGEERLGGKTNKHNLENATEALIGAIYLDSEFLEAQKFILRFWAKFLAENIFPPQDPVSQLQELIQSKTKQLPQYITEKESGLEHAPVFISQVIIPNSSDNFFAKGNSKKEAQKNVAKIALEFFLKDHKF